MNMLRLELLGAPQVTRDGCPVTGFVSTKAQALLYYLAITGRPRSRSTLAGLLWGELPEVDARTSLRQVLSNLRHLVGEHLQITRETVAFDRTMPYWLDVEQMQTSLQSSGSTSEEDINRLCASVELYRGDLLEGLYVRVAPDFEEWLLIQRERLRLLALNGMHQLTTQLMARGDYASALDSVTRLLALDPLREDAHRQLMLLLAQSGQYDAALRQYQRCVRALANELGVEPAIETTALYEQIRKDATIALAIRRVQLPNRPVTERHHLTLLGCQIGGLLALAEYLDPNELDEVMRACHQIVTDVAEAFGGQVAEYRSDGVMIAFKYPQPNDNDALAAVRAGLALIEAFDHFESPVVRPGILTAQIGVHTGLVNVDERNSNSATPLPLVGLPVMVINRLQAIAEESTLLVSASIERLVREKIPCVAYRTHVFHELKQPLAVFQVQPSRTYIELPSPMTRLKAQARHEGDVPVLTNQRLSVQARSLHVPA